ncbi:hypothetical protein CWE13_08685 [Aliidiomarina shirensis]|uniref:TonB C-terminal domain-containing protein n=1 Tax=Aliidiomarina shirensis TaxID=1048642 RepID=A0A432WT10_9GAMM|nr:TonB family protein [Aliidiomarina shirensis]RUO36911.1 hypothetical protein CWE13_08685 [Aliidiomarina shirensis]
MINSLTTSLWLIALACAVLLLLRIPVLRYLGARTQYSLWFAVPLAALLPWLPSFPATRGIATPFTVTPNIVQNADTLISSQSYLWLWVWAAGVAILLVWMMLTSLSFYRSLYRAQGVKARSGFPFKVHYSSAIHSPAIIGLIQPRLLLPSDFDEQYTVRQQSLIIAHERLHWQRGDLHFNLLAYVLLAINWFNPIAWLAYRSYRRDQELACDAVIINRYPKDTKTYAEALLVSSLAFSKDRKVAVQFGTPHLNHYGAHPMKQRLQHLTNQHGYSYLPLLGVFAIAAAAWLFLMNPATANQLFEGKSNTIEHSIPPAIVRVLPTYPEAAKEQGLAGTVELRFDITDAGTTSNISLEVTGSDEVLQESAINALKYWRFDPAHVGEDYGIAFTFELE